MVIVTLFDELLKDILSAEEIFLQNPRDFHTLETTLKSSTENFAAKFLGEVLSGLDDSIRNSSWREGKYTVHRQEKRTIISTEKQRIKQRIKLIEKDCLADAFVVK